MGPPFTCLHRSSLPLAPSGRDDADARRPGRPEGAATTDWRTQVAPSTTSSGQRRRERSRGQSLVELALFLPMFLTLCLGIIDGGRAFYYREAVTNAAREALRVAQSTGQQANANTVCGGTGLGTATAHIPMQGAETTGPLATIATRAGLESSGNGSASTSAVAR